jgi:hypothetical protein
MALPTKPLTRQRLANELADRLETLGLKRGEPKLANDNWGSRWCELATWKNVGKTFKIYAYFGNYLGYGEMVWVGFGSREIEVINETQREFSDHQITQVNEGDWETMWDKSTEVHKALLSTNNAVIEDYRETESPYVWFGRYMRLNDDSLARSMKFILDILRGLDPVIFSGGDDLEWSGLVEKDAIVKVRLVQNAFRRDLKVHWGECCAVTGSGLGEALRASHIVAWAESTNAEKRSVDNGLLLTASLDALFDRGYISFSQAGAIIISPLLTPDEREIYRLHDALKLRMLPSNKQKAFLERHQSKHGRRLGLIPQ